VRPGSSTSQLPIRLPRCTTTFYSSTQENAQSFAALPRRPSHAPELPTYHLVCRVLPQSYIAYPYAFAACFLSVQFCFYYPRGMGLSQLTTMAVDLPPRPLKRPLHRRTPSNLDAVPEDAPVMAAQDGASREKSRSQPEIGVSELSSRPLAGDSTHAGGAMLGDNPLSTPGLSRSGSFSASSAYMDDSDADEGSFFPPVERLTMFDFIENLALTQRVEKIQNSISSQTERLRKVARERSQNTRDRAVEEWRRRVPTEGEQLDKYKKRMRQSVDRLSERWASTTAVTTREKASFIAAVMNIFVSGYLVGGRPEWFPLWYGAQLFYFMPIRWYTYHKKGYHYFLADLCYFVNLLVVMSIWIFPNSKRLFISTYCLAFGNNAVAIVMWRNSLVFHSMDKVVR